MVWTKDNRVISGVTRWSVARSLGIPESITVNWIDFNRD
jgi:hypothetical protein